MACVYPKVLEISLDNLVGNSNLHMGKTESIKYLIFKNLIPKIKGMFLPCSTLFCNLKKLKKFLLRKIIEPLGLSGFVRFLWLPYAVLLVCPTATTAPHTQQRQTVGFELFQLYQQRQKLKKCSLPETTKPLGLGGFVVFYGCPTLCCWYALLLRPHTYTTTANSGLRTFSTIPQRQNTNNARNAVIRDSKTKKAYA